MSFSTDLKWATTILHEAVHGYLLNYHYENNIGFQTDYGTLVSQFNQYKNWNDVHHEMFAVTLRTKIQEAITEYGDSRGYNLGDQFYEDLSWVDYLKLMRLIIYLLLIKEEF